MSTTLPPPTLRKNRPGWLVFAGGTNEVTMVSRQVAMPRPLASQQPNAPPGIKLIPWLSPAARLRNTGSAANRYSNGMKVRIKVMSIRIR